MRVNSSASTKEILSTLPGALRIHSSFAIRNDAGDAAEDQIANAPPRDRHAAECSSAAMISAARITSEYFCLMSKRLARCGSSARSPTQSLATTVR